MSVSIYELFHLDYCLACKGVWFDNDELVDIWNTQWDRLIKKDATLQHGVNSRGESPAFFADLVFHASDAVVSGTGQVLGEMGASAVNMSAHLVSQAPQLAGTAAEGVGELAGGAAEGVGELAGVAAEGAGAVVGVVAEGAGELAGVAAEGAGVLAEIVFAVIAEIIGSIFS